MGVPLFFCLSGYLVWNSVKASSCKEYFTKRFVRIYPELWLAVILEVLSILIFYREKIEYLWLSAFALTQGTVLQFWTPDFLRGYGCGTPNGSLWTICTIIQFYIVIWFVRKWLQNRKPMFWGIIFTVSITVSYFSTYLKNFLPELIYKLYNQTLIPYLWLFILGVLMCEHADKMIPVLKKYWIISLLTYVLLRFLFKYVDIVLCGSYPLIGSILMMLSVIGLAYALPSLNIKKDISYGIYIYHMIVVNVMIQLGMTGKLYFLLIATLITVALSVGSSWLVGRISQRFKKNYLN